MSAVSGSVLLKFATAEPAVMFSSKVDAETERSVEGALLSETSLSGIVREPSTSIVERSVIDL